MTASGAAPGWYADADDPALIRWWDGAAWTDHTQPNPAALPEPMPAPVPAASAPMSSAPYVPPPFADPPPPPPTGALDYPPPAISSPELASPAAPGAPAASTTAAGSAAIAATAPGAAAPGRGGGSMPISEPVRLVPPTSGSIPVAGFPGFDDPLPKAKPSSGPAPLAVPTPLPPPGAAAEAGSTGPASGSFAVAPLATATPLPASASTPWTSSTTFAQPTSAVDLASVDYEPMTRSWGSARPVSAPRAITGVTTGGAWMLALSPLIHLGLAALVWWITDGGTTSVTPYVAGGFGAAAVLWLVLGALTDYRRLGALGHEFRPSVGWIVLGPFFYLLSRAIHVYRSTRRGTGPTWVFVALALIVGGAGTLAGLALPRDASLAELRAVEVEIAADLREQGLEYEVICPSEASASFGATFVCTAYDEVGPAALLRVMWTGVAGDFTYAFESAPE